MSIDVVDLDHVALRVTDLEESLAFYRDLLGLPVRDRDRYEAGEVPYVAVVAGGRHLHLVPTDDEDDGGSDGDGGGDRAADRDSFDIGGEHICLLVRSDEMETEAEIEALLDEIEAAGYAVEADEPYKRYGAYGRDWAAYVRDPDGRRVELKLH
ncbi:VOC family protein [Haloparvum sp. PAK95]|uniref:VOC family protein n=1 Tax=Haloparvum sp. PAK95 TaxID=3418962 RepID=UPI003D2EDB0A